MSEPRIDDEPTIVIRRSEAEDEAEEIPGSKGPGAPSAVAAAAVVAARVPPLEEMSPRLREGVLKARELLRIRDLRPGQAEIMESVLAGRDRTPTRRPEPVARAATAGWPVVRWLASPGR